MKRRHFLAIILSLALAPRLSRLSDREKILNMPGRWRIEYSWAETGWQSETHFVDGYQNGFAAYNPPKEFHSAIEKHCRHIWLPAT